MSGSYKEPNEPPPIVELSPIPLVFATGVLVLDMGDTVRLTWWADHAPDCGGCVGGECERVLAARLVVPRRAYTRVRRQMLAIE